MLPDKNTVEINFDNKKSTCSICGSCNCAHISDTTEGLQKDPYDFDAWSQKSISNRPENVQSFKLGVYNVIIIFLSKLNLKVILYILQESIRSDEIPLAKALAGYVHDDDSTYLENSNRANSNSSENYLENDDARSVSPETVDDDKDKDFVIEDYLSCSKISKEINNLTILENCSLKSSDDLENSQKAESSNKNRKLLVSNVSRKGAKY